MLLNLYPGGFSGVCHLAEPASVAGRGGLCRWASDVVVDGGSFANGFALGREGWGFALRFAGACTQTYVFTFISAVLASSPLEEGVVESPLEVFKARCCKGFK